jgi:hypothetical protein
MKMNHIQGYQAASLGKGSNQVSQVCYCAERMKQMPKKKRLERDDCEIYGGLHTLVQRRNGFGNLRTQGIQITVWSKTMHGVINTKARKPYYWCLVSKIVPIFCAGTINSYRLSCACMFWPKESF